MEVEQGLRHVDAGPFARMLRVCESFAAVRGVVIEVVSGFVEYMRTVRMGVWFCLNVNVV